MSSWENIKSNVTSFAKTAAKKTEQLTDTAIFKVKISAKENEISNQYKALGALVYQKLKEDDSDNAAELTEKISECVTKLDALRAALDKLKAEYKKHIESTKPQKKVSVSVGNGKAEPDAEVLEGFNKARAEGDENFAVATDLADNAAEISAEAQKLAEDAQAIADSL